MIFEYCVKLINILRSKNYINAFQFNTVQDQQKNDSSSGYHECLDHSSILLQARPVTVCTRCITAPELNMKCLIKNKLNEVFIM